MRLVVKDIVSSSTHVRICTCAKMFYGVVTFVVTLGCTMSTHKTLVNLRLDPSLLNEIKMLGGTRTEHITKALQLYLQPDTQNRYNVDMVLLLQEQVVSLSHEKEALQKELLYFSLPWYVRVFRSKDLLFLPVNKK